MATPDAQTSSYHHGDLRNALITAGVAMLTDVGAQGISLRKLAKQVGVSHNAPYMHFADKEALLAAIAEEGFGILTAEVGTAIAQERDDWPQQLHAAGWAYVNFALTHPSHLQVMFQYYEPEKYPDVFAASSGALQQLQGVIDEGQAAGYVKDGDSREMAVMIWSLLHGMSVIMIGKKMPLDKAADALTKQFIDMAYLGVRRVDEGNGREAG